ERFPALREAFARLFPQQPRRCVELLANLGLVAHLDRPSQTPLRALEVPAHPADARDWPPGWREVYELAPELAPAIAACRHAQCLLGGSEDPPPGARRALERPRRLEGELAWLERASADAPDNEALAKRAGTVRALLADADGLRATARVEVTERLRQI